MDFMVRANKDIGEGYRTNRNEPEIDVMALQLEIEGPLQVLGYELRAGRCYVLEPGWGWA